MQPKKDNRDRIGINLSCDCPIFSSFHSYHREHLISLSVFFLLGNHHNVNVKQIFKFVSAIEID